MSSKIHPEKNASTKYAAPTPVQGEQRASHAGSMRSMTSAQSSSISNSNSKNSIGMRQSASARSINIKVRGEDDDDLDDMPSDADEQSTSASVFSASMRSMNTTKSSLFSESKQSINMAIYSKNILMGCMERIPLVMKLMFMLLPPVIGVLVLGIILVVVRAQDTQNERSTQDFLKISVQLGSFIHEFQKERGFTSSWYASPATYQSQVTAQRLLTDQQREIVTNQVLSHDFSRYGSLVETAAATFKVQFDAIPTKRVGFDTGTIPSAQAVAYFSQTIATGLDLINRMSQLAKSTSIMSILTPFSVLLRIKERWGQTRAYGNQAFAAGAFSETLYTTFLSVRGEYHSLNLLFQCSAGADDLALVKQIVSGPTVDTSNAAIAYLLEANNRGLVTNDTTGAAFAAGFWNNITDVINLHQQAVLEITDIMNSIQTQNMSFSVSNMVIVLLLMVVIAFTCIFASVLCSRVTLGPWSRMNIIQDASIKKFLSPGFMNIMGVKTVTELKIGQSVSLPLCIMFLDIRGFTTISEKLSPSQTFALVNAFLSAVGPAVRVHHGYIDKYLGDGFMAVFQRPRNAVLASVDIIRRLKEWNELNRSQSQSQQVKEDEKPYPPIKVGIGMNFGLCIAGTMGENERVDGSIVGDVVNASSRIESLTKHYGCLILASDSVLQLHKQGGAAAATNVITRFIGNIKVKGKHHPQAIHEILMPGYDAVQDLKVQTLQQYEQAIKLSMTRGMLSEALELLEQIAERNPDDLTVQLRIELCRKLKQEGKACWDGLEEMLVKQRGMSVDNQIFPLQNPKL